MTDEDRLLIRELITAIKDLTVAIRPSASGVPQQFIPQFTHSIAAHNDPLRGCGGSGQTNDHRTHIRYRS